MKKPESKTILPVLFYGSVAAAIFFVIASHTLEPRAFMEKKVLQADSHSFDHLALDAKAVYVLDTAKDKALYIKNAHTPLPIASITKIMTVLCAFYELPMSDIVQIQRSDIGSTTKSSLSEGEKWRVDDLASLMLVQSSNDAATAFGRIYGGTPAIIECMNAKAKSLGLFDTKFANETGLDIGSSPGAYGSAEDTAKLFAFALEKYPDIFGKTALKSYNVLSVSGIQHEVNNTDRALDSLPFVLASKTGLTDLAGGNLVFAMNVGLNHTVIIVILGSTEEGRFADALTLSGATIRALGGQ